MAGRRNAGISVPITAEADFTQARRDAKTALDKIERDAKPIELSAELDTTEIRKAIDLAGQLDGLVASMTIDTDAGELVEAEKLARSLRNFQGRVGLSVEGKAELTDALGLAEKMDQLRKVRVEVQGRQDLERAAEIADDLERSRTIPIDAQLGDLRQLDSELTAAGERGADGIAGALGDIDYGDIGGSAADQMSGALAAAGPWAAAGGAVAAIFGDEFVQGFNNALPDGRGDTIRALRNNLTGPELAEVGQAGGEAYSAGLADGLTDAKDAAALIKGELAGIDDGLDLKEVTRQALALERVFGTDLATSVAAVDKLVSQGLVKNSEEGFNLLFELGQQTGGQFDEMLELTSEFSTALRALGIDGPRGLKLIGEMVERGIFPQVDQAGEVFEELNETILNGGAAEALESIGLNAEEMQRIIAGGGPEAAAAIAQIAAVLTDVDDNARQAQLTTAIFGGNMGLLGDDAREAALQLFETAGGIDQVGTAASDGATSIEEAASGLDRLKLAASELGGELGGLAADGLDTLNALAELDFGTAASSAADFGTALAERIVNPLSAIGVELPGDPFGAISDGIDRLRGKTDDLDFGPAVAGAEALNTAAREGTPQIKELADGSDVLAGSLEGAADEADALEAELRGIFDFSADQLFRDIAEAGDELADTLANGGAEAVGLGGSIDISTEAGRRLQSQMEGLTDILIDAGVAQADGSITAEQLASAHSILRDQLASTGATAGLTAQEVDDLIAKYLNVPSEVVTNLRAVDEATAVVKNLQSELSKLKDKTITVTTRNTIIAATAATAKARAKGGWTDGLTLVGEEGPELIDVQGRAFVHTAAETRSILSNRGGDLPSSGAPSPVAGTRPRAFIENATIMVAPGVDVWQQALLAEKVYAVLAG